MSPQPAWVSSFFSSKLIGSVANPVSNPGQALNPAGIVLESNPATGGILEQRGMISNGANRYMGTIRL
jgi:hypothetical protein